MHAFFWVIGAAALWSAVAFRASSTASGVRNHGPRSRHGQAVDDGFGSGSQPTLLTLSVLAQVVIEDRSDDVPVRARLVRRLLPPKAVGRSQGGFDRMFRCFMLLLGRWLQSILHAPTSPFLLDQTPRD